MSRSEGEALQDLLARLEEAEGLDRDLDADIHWQFVGQYEETSDSLRPRFDLNAGLAWDQCFGRRWRERAIPVPYLTSSQDAIMALIERCLPPIKAFASGSPASSGWKINLYRGMTPTGAPHAKWEACIRPHAGREDWISAPTAALALCKALGRALAQIAPSDNSERPDCHDGAVCDDPSCRAALAQAQSTEAGDGRA